MNTPRRMADFANAPGVSVLAAGGAWIAYSVSGGKDSSAAIAATMPILDAIGHPREKRFLLHSDLGRSEWQSTGPHVEELARHFDLPLHLVRHTTHDMVSRWERRGDLGIERWKRGETTNLVAPWSSASLRLCTSEMKIHVMSKFKKNLDGPIVTVMGIRRDESRGRSRAPYETQDTGMKRYGREECLSWNPIADWSSDEVFAVHDEQKIPLHEAYSLGSTRLSCNFCVLASINDLTVSSQQTQNLETYLHLVEMEARYRFSFQPSRWLADVRPGILPVSLLGRIENAKAIAKERRSIEQDYPEAWRKRKPHELAPSDWSKIIKGRNRIAEIHGFTDYISDPRAA